MIHVLAKSPRFGTLSPWQGCSWTIAIEFDVSALCVGLLWERSVLGMLSQLHLRLCVPLFSVHLHVVRMSAERGRR